MTLLSEDSIETLILLLLKVLSIIWLKSPSDLYPTVLSSKFKLLKVQSPELTNIPYWSPESALPITERYSI